MARYAFQLTSLCFAFCPVTPRFLPLISSTTSGIPPVFMREADLESHVWHGAHDFESGRRGVDALLSAPERPMAIFAANDALAIGVMDRLFELSLKVPDDMSVVGFDDIPAAGSKIFSLTTLHLSAQALAEAAVEQALRIVTSSDGSQKQNGKVGGSRVTVPVALQIRGSTAKPPV